MAKMNLEKAATMRRSPEQARAQIDAERAAQTKPPAVIVSKSAYFLVPIVPDADQARKDCAEGTELKALLRTMGDTHAVVLFKHPAGIQIWRHQEHVATVMTVGQIFALAERRGW